ncbi:NAD(P)-dependent oxidoreductase [Paenibacillus sp. P96]|uniref:dihydrouracil dehydrogenase (NAD(+)) n=1 Tax=Paenibacillus zeirhizosphaerae TaxID=2987519 RepID=A0ABT9FX29_9BACL|nr:NAD(P)-dependent oxidoreductase [Paenibacillus sp. P96]MDP4099289.1 NAD(P)-dependent oxidoreductase [Paenibacillus sp. P96]
MDPFSRNFAEMPGLTARGAMEESNRCLYCYDAPCIQACPTGINIPSFIKRIATGNLAGAAHTIMESNPVGASCARVCPTEELCEGACVLNATSEPIAIGLLQRYATDWAMADGRRMFKPGAPTGIRVAVIGGGPAGLSAARELARGGYEVTVYEERPFAGGLNTYGIVSFRLPQQISLWEVEQVKELGVNIRTGTKVGRDIAADRLLAEYDAVVLAAGMGYVPPLGLEGEQLEGVYDAIELVESTKEGVPPCSFAGKRVAVIGAGNTAIDAATTAMRLGAGNVKIVYRRTKEEMTAYNFEYRFAKQEGVEFEWLTSPARIIGDDAGRVASLECVRMELTGERGKDGRPVPAPVADSLHRIAVDVVISAIGQQRRTGLIDMLGLQHARGVVEIDPVTRRTSNPKVYAAGDIIFGAGQGEAMVVSAAEQGKQAAYAIINEMAGQSGAVRPA